MRIAALGFVALVLASPATAGSRSRYAVDRTLDSSLVQQINQVREQHGLAPLRTSKELERAATAHTLEMLARGYFAHDSSDGSPFWKRIRRFYCASGCRVWKVGENLVWRSPELSGGEALQAWLTSPEHRQNLLAPAWREIGLVAMHVPSAPGAFGGSPVTLVTADFGARTP